MAQTPADIGRKPDGDQLRDMDSDKLSRRARFRKELYRNGSLATAGLALGLEAKVEVQTILLGVLAADLGLDDAGLSLFVGQARELADRWLSERA